MPEFCVSKTELKIKILNLGKVLSKIEIFFSVEIFDGPFEMAETSFE